jgi:hypothetical protein
MTHGGFDATYRDAADFQKIIASYAEKTAAIIEGNDLGL